MDEKTILSLIEAILASNDKKKVEYNLWQLAESLRSGKAPKNYVNMVEALRKVSPEVMALYQKSEVREITRADLEEAIIKGKQKGLREREPLRAVGC